MEYQPDEWQEIEGAEQVEQAAAPSPSEQTTQSPSQQLEVMDKQLLERILNPRPENPNPVDVNNPIIIDPSDMQAITPLGLAAFWGWEDIINQLCTKGARVSEPMPTNTLPNLQGFTPLHIAVMLNKPDAAKTLLAHGAAINAKIDSVTEYNGLTPLDLASTDDFRFDEIVTLLAQHGAKKSDALTPKSAASQIEGVDKQNLLLTRYRTQDGSRQESTSYDIQGKTPLINAILAGNVALVQTLIAQGSNPDTPIVALEHNKNSFAGFSPLCLASFLGYIPVIETLLQHGANPNYVIKNNTEGWNGFSPIHVAIIRKNPVVVMRLINRGADINKPTSPDKGYRLTPLSLAASMGYNDIIKILSIRVLVDYTVDGFTSLHHAIMQKQPEAVFALVRNGATINAIINNPSHELHNFNTICLAVRRSDINSHRILVYLIQINADPQHKITSNSKYNNYTPLTLAIITGNIEAVKRLIGANIDLSKEDLSAALNYFRQHTPQAAYSEMLNYIEKAKISQQVLALAKEFNEILGKLEIKSYETCNPNECRDIIRKTELIFYNLEIILLQGADSNIQLKSGLTPIFAAITPFNIINESLREKFIKLLLSHGAKLDIATNQGQSPLTLAVIYNNAHLVKMLLDAGADPNYGVEKPLIIARTKKYSDIEKILENAIYEKIKKQKEKEKKPEAQKSSRISRVLSTLSKTLKR